MEDIKIFRGSGLNKDDDLDLIQGGDSRNRDNVGFIDGNYDILVPRKVPENLAKSLPSSNNPTIIGTCPDKENDAIIYFYTDDSNNHSIYRVFADESLDTLSNSESFWNFSTDYPITHAFIIGDGDDATLVFTDNYNPIRAVLITTLTDGDTLTIANACLHKPPPLYALTGTIETDAANHENNIYGNYFQFAYRYIYDNNQKTTLSPRSDIIYDYENEYTHTPLVASLDLSNYIELTIPIDYSNVSKVDILVRNIDVGSGAQDYWYLYDTVDASGASITYDFYGGSQGYVFGESEANRLFDDVPDLAKAIELTSENRVVVGGFTKGLDNTSPNVSLGAFAYDDLTTTAPETVADTASIANGANDNVDFTASYTGTEAYLLKIVFADDTVEVYSVNDSSIYADADAIVDHLVDVINNQNTHFVAATPASNIGGDALDIDNDSGQTCVVTLYRFAIYDKAKTLHTPAKHFFGLRYKDQFGKCGAVVTGENFILQLDNIGNHYPSISGSNIDERIWRCKYQINHLPPTWATTYQWMYGGSNITKYFSLPIKVLCETGCDVTPEGERVKVDLGQALERYLEYQGIESYENYFFPAKGDKIVFRAIISASVSGSLIASYPRDSVVLEADAANDCVYVANTNSLFDYIDGGTIEHYIITEFYKTTSALEPENRVYYEIGEVLDITSGYHQASGDTNFNGVTIQHQTSVLPALGSIDFGDSYVMRQIIHYDPSDFLTGYIHCQSASLFHDSEYSGVGRYGVVDEEASAKFYNAVMWSGVWRDSDLSYSEFNKFEDSDIKYLSDKHGPICALKEMGYTLYVFQRSKLTPIEIGRQTVEQDGQTMVVSTSVVLGSARPFNEDFGTIYPGSIAVFDGGLIFYDPLTMGVYWLRQDGLQNIAKIKMVSFFKDLSNTIQTEGTDNYHCWSFYDIRTESYVLAVIDETTPANNFSLSFHVPSQKWMCTENYKYEGMVSFGGNKVVSFDSGEIYMHHEDSQTHELGYLDIHFNPVPTKHVLFRGVDVLSTYLWSSSDNPSIWVDEDEAEYEETDTYLTYNGAQQSLIPDGRWEKINGRWKASYLRNKLYRDGTDGGDIRLYQGDRLAGRHLTQRLTNTEATETNKLKSALLKYTTKS